MKSWLSKMLGHHISDLNAESYWNCLAFSEKNHEKKIFKQQKRFTVISPSLEDLPSHAKP